MFWAGSSSVQISHIVVSTDCDGDAGSWAVVAVRRRREAGTMAFIMLYSLLEFCLTSLTLDSIETSW